VRVGGEYWLESLSLYVSGAIVRWVQLSAECGIMMLAYIDRILNAGAGGVTLHASNWRRITLSTLILASKGE
jgi:hypothetical protein